MGDTFTDRPNTLRLRRAKRTGWLICIASLFLAGLFMVGLWTRSYWALAIPVGGGVFTVVFLTFWIGYTINTVKGIPAEADHYEGRGARTMAKLICVASLGAGGIFLWGVFLRSYWALAIPVAAVVLTLAAMVFWIGWAIVTQRSTLSETPGAEQSQGVELGEVSEVPADAGP